MLKRLRFRILINLFEPERGLVVHLAVGIHVADVAVADQVHVTKFSNSTNVALTTWRHVRQFKF